MSAATQQSKALAFLRISIGLLFLIFAEYKLTSTRFIWGGMASSIRGFLDQGSYPFICNECGRRFHSLAPKRTQAISTPEPPPHR